MTSLPTACVVDASVGIKLFVTEDHTDDVQELFRTNLTNPGLLLLVPDLFFIECANILWKKVRRGEYLAELAMGDIIALGSLQLSSTPTFELMERSLEIACIYSITAYDACYVALAESYGLPLVTADQRLAAAMRNHVCEIVVLGQILN